MHKENFKLKGQTNRQIRNAKDLQAATRLPQNLMSQPVKELNLTGNESNIFFFLGGGGGGGCWVFLVFF